MVTEGMPAHEDRRGTYGETVTASADGRGFRAGVFDEQEVRAAAGITLAIGAIALALAVFEAVYLPIRLVTAFFALEFLVRVTAGLPASPVGRVARRLVRRQPPQWVSARPKRFAWRLGLVVSLAMVAIGLAGIRGPLPQTICMICLVLMWLEAAVGLCVGCETHRVLVRHGWLRPDPGFEVCTHGACGVDARPEIPR